MKGTLIFTLTLLLGVAGFLTTGFAQTYDHQDTLNEGTGLARALAFSPNGELLASGGGSNVYLHDPGTGMLERTLRGHTAVVTVVAFSPDGSMLASASGDRTIKLWNPQTGRLIRTLRGHTNQIYAMAFSRTGQLASGGRDNTVRLWDTQTGTNRILGRHDGWVLGIAFSYNGLLASSGRDNTIRIWNATTGAPMGALIGHTNFVTSVAFTATGDTLVSGSSDNTLRIWNAATGGAALQILRGHTDAVNSVAVSVNGTIASASADETVRLWNLQTGQPIATLDEQTDLVRVVAFSHDRTGQRLASGSVDGTVQVYQRSRTAPIPIVTFPTATGIQVTITPDPANTNVEIGATINLTVKVSNAGQAAAHDLVILEATTDIPEKLMKVPDFDEFDPLTGRGTTDAKGELKAALKVKDLATAGTFKLIATMPKYPDARGELSFTVGTGADEVAGSITISSSKTTVEPKGGSENGRIPLTFKVTSKVGGNAMRGEKIAISERTTSGNVASQLSSASLTTDGDGEATTNLELQNSSATGTIQVTAHVEGSDPRVSGTLNITVKQTATSLSVSGVPSSITSGGTRTITATVTSKNGTGMSGVTVEFVDTDDKEIAFSRTSRTTNSSGEASTTLRTGSKGSASISVKSPGDTDSMTVTVNPDTTSKTLHDNYVGRRIPIWKSNYWYDHSMTFAFPGDVVSANVRSSTYKVNVKTGTISGRYVTVPMRVLAKTLPRADVDVWVDATYEVTAPSPGAPALHSQFGPETQQLSTFWQDLSRVPEETALLPNYPNPFNPETWIPYRLAESAEVTLTIYSLNGNRVRTLALGHQPAGFYESRSRAAYWDGRNAIGERVASGVYFYTLTAGDFAATSKMLILK